jgi:hypothetical protein
MELRFKLPTEVFDKLIREMKEIPGGYVLQSLTQYAQGGTVHIRYTKKETATDAAVKR